MRATRAEALDTEQQALDAYQDFLPRVAGHATLDPFIRRQIATETEHINGIHTVVDVPGPSSLVPKPCGRLRS